MTKSPCVIENLWHYMWMKLDVSNFEFQDQQLELGASNESVLFRLWILQSYRRLSIHGDVIILWEKL